MQLSLEQPGCVSVRHERASIEYRWGTDITRLHVHPGDSVWYEQIEKVTREEPHLLPKTREELQPAAEDGRIILATYDKMDKCGGPDELIVAGCIVLWELERDHHGDLWYELGTFFVRPSFRFSRTGMSIGDTLYGLLLHLHSNKNILATTTNEHAIHTGMRHGMQMVSFHSLPELIHHATCICPMEKTGACDNANCLLKDRVCRVRVPFPTWVRMGCPKRLSYP